MFPSKVRGISTQGTSRSVVFAEEKHFQGRFLLSHSAARTVSPASGPQNASDVGEFPPAPVKDERGHGISHSRGSEQLNRTPVYSQRLRSYLVVGN